MQARQPQGQKFGMCCWIVVGLNPVDAARDDLAILDDHGPERTTARFYIVECKGDRLFEKLIDVRLVR